MLNERKARARFVGERYGFLLGPQQFSDRLDLSGDSVRRRIVVNHGQRDARIANQLERRWRPRAVDRKHPGRLERQDSLSRQSAHVTDVWRTL